MSDLRRLNAIITRGVVPFNFGSTWEDWQKDWQRFGADWPGFAGMTEPHLWTDAEKAACNEQAARETAIVNDLMGIEDWDAFVDRLAYYEQQVTPPQSPSAVHDPCDGINGFPGEQVRGNSHEQ